MMNLEERVKSVEVIATLLADSKGSAAWSVESGKLFLRVEAGPKKWSISANAEPRELGENMCADYLLRKMAHAAGVCPKCLAPVRRKGSDPVTHKTAHEHCRCPSCLHSWTDS